MSLDSDPNSISKTPDLSASFSLSAVLAWLGIFVLGLSAFTYVTIFGAGYAFGTRFFTATFLAVLFAVLKPGVFQALAPQYDLNPTKRVVSILGVGTLIAASTFALAQQELAPATVPVFALWLLGAVMTTCGVARLLVPAERWRTVFAKSGWSVIPVFIIGYFLLDAIEWMRLIADWFIFDAIIDWLTEITLIASANLMYGLGFDVYTIPATRELGMEDFYVYVWGPCSGIEGFVLISAFLSIYIWMFRKTLDFPRVFILFPIGIALSWCLNVVRISTLLYIGARISPDLAVDSFHSHAGWLMFTLLAVTLTAATSAFGWFHLKADSVKAPQTAGHRQGPATLPFLRDPNIAQILPFIVFMASAFLIETFTQSSTPYYPLRAAAMLAVLVLIGAYLRDLDWSLSLPPIAAGGAIGVIWLLTTPAVEAGSDPVAVMFASMSGAAIVFWIAARTIGTVLLVPIIEELFFRGYLLRKLDTGSVFMRILAILVSTAAFALLHQRWLAAFLAGLVFAMITLWRGRVSDAIICHAVANGIIAA